ncbi:MAG: hypothetical protein ACI8RD_011189 [Bacillariaceae sp.]|jgi:hypothetical protein
MMIVYALPAVCFLAIAFLGYKKYLACYKFKVNTATQFLNSVYG